MSETRREHEGPRTYHSAWQHREDGTAVLLTAEDWLEEEAMVYASLAVGDEEGEGETDEDYRAGIMRAIAKEIATLRRERSQWAEQATRLIGECRLLAKLAAETPQFSNPLVAWEAQAVRDRWLTTEPADAER